MKFAYLCAFSSFYRLYLYPCLSTTIYSLNYLYIYFRNIIKRRTEQLWQRRFLKEVDIVKQQNAVYVLRREQNHLQSHWKVWVRKMSMSDRLPFSEHGQLLFLGRLARQHKVSQNCKLSITAILHICYLQAQSYEVVVLRQGGFGEKAVELAKDLLAAVLRYVTLSH